MAYHRAWLSVDGNYSRYYIIYHHTTDRYHHGCCTPRSKLSSFIIGRRSQLQYMLLLLFREKNRPIKNVESYVIGLVWRRCTDSDQTAS